MPQEGTQIKKDGPDLFLLPDTLVPYKLYTIDAVMDICGQFLVKGKSKSQIADTVYFSFDDDDILNFEERHILHLLTLFEQTVFKLQDFLTRLNQTTTFLAGSGSLQAGWHYLTNFRDDSGIYTGASGFSRFIYAKLGGYAVNPQFLFGTAYQFL